MSKRRNDEEVSILLSNIAPEDLLKINEQITTLADQIIKAASMWLDEFVKTWDILSEFYDLPEEPPTDPPPGRYIDGEKISVGGYCDAGSN